MRNVIEKLWKSVCQREAAAYLAAGVLTTVINIVVYDILCSRFYIENLTANIFAWLAAVLFAFIANDLFVFSKKEKKNKLRIRLVRFIGARLASLAADEAGMFVMVELLLINNMSAKVFMNIIVIIINYALSKKMIFN